MPRFQEHQIFPSGVRWEPTQPASLSETYVASVDAYLEKNEDDTRTKQLEIERNKR